MVNTTTMGTGVQPTTSTNQPLTVTFTPSTTSVATTTPAAAVSSFASAQSSSSVELSSQWPTGTMPLAQGQQVPTSTAPNLLGEYALPLQRAPLGSYSAANQVIPPPPGFERVKAGQALNGSQMYPPTSHPNVPSNLTVIRPQPQPNAHPGVSSVQATSPNNPPVQGSNYYRSPYRENTPPYVTPSVPSSSIGYLPHDHATNAAGVHYSATSLPAGPRHDQPSHKQGCEPMDTDESNV